MPGSQMSFVTLLGVLLVLNHGILTLVQEGDPLSCGDYFSDTEGTAKDDQPTPAAGDAVPLPVKPATIEEVSSTTRPFCAGCPVEVDSEDPKIKEMGLFAFNTHLSNFDALDQAQRMVRVVNAMTQIVAGQKYILDLEVGLTNCTKEQHDNTPQECQLDPSEDTFICNFEIVEQSWSNSKEVVRSNCKNEKQDDVEDDDDEDNSDTEQVLTRNKREAQVLGGPRRTEESKEKLMELASFAVQQLDAIDADNDARMVVEVLDSKKQTVSGWLYDIKMRVAHTTCPETESVTMEKCKDKIVMPYRICSVKILFQPWQEVQKKVTESQCYPEKYKKGKKLSMKKQLMIQKFKEVNEVTDDKKFGKRADSKQMLGGFQDVDVESQELTELLHFIVESIDAQSNALHAQKLVKVMEAQRQIVAGVRTKFVVELGYTQCRKKPSLDKSQCQIDDKREHQFCNVTVWEQPWLRSKQITHSMCGNRVVMFQETREKRSLSLSQIGIHLPFTNYNHKEFKNFAEKYNKQYQSEGEYAYRLGVYKENMKKVKLLQENEQGTAQYGATVFADMTEEEFGKHHLGLRPDLKQNARAMKKAKIPVLTSIPEEFDWRNYNAVTPVKNQGMCGSCWAFSVTGNIEGVYAKTHNELVSLSEQELVDCDTLDEGCNGGLPENAYKAIQKLGGLETETSYPYDGHNDKCSFERSKIAAKVKGFVELPKNETEMAMWLVKNGPISIGINANAMQFYFGGVSHPWKFLCGKKSLDHGVLIVGYGVHTYPLFNRTLPYWSVKNSWGDGWGEQGYYRVYRGENTCGLAEMPTSAVVE